MYTDLLLKITEMSTNVAMTIPYVFIALASRILRKSENQKAVYRI
jgi:hypothetical protein